MTGRAQVHGTLSAELGALGRKVSDAEVEAGRQRAAAERSAQALEAAEGRLREAEAALELAREREAELAGRVREERALALQEAESLRK